MLLRLPPVRLSITRFKKPSSSSSSVGRSLSAAVFLRPPWPRQGRYPCNDDWGPAAVDHHHHHKLGFDPFVRNFRELITRARPYLYIYAFLSLGCRAFYALSYLLCVQGCAWGKYIERLTSGLLCSRYLSACIVVRTYICRMQVVEEVSYYRTECPNWKPPCYNALSYYYGTRKIMSTIYAILCHSRKIILISRRRGILFFFTRFLVIFYKKTSILEFYSNKIGSIYLFFV